MVRRAVLVAVTSALFALAAAGAAGAATTALYLSQGAAFSIIGHSCGGIQEHPYATGFGAGGYPLGEVYMQTSCGGSGRGGGYKSTTYSGWAKVQWDWYGDTRSFSRLEGAAEVSTSFSETDPYGDHIYNTASAAYLEATSPPVLAPAAPTSVTATQSNIEVGETVQLRFQVYWSPAPETAGLITSSTVTATPTGGSTAPVLTATVNGSATGAIVGPLAPLTTYKITVTNSDPEGTSQASTPIEATTPNEDGETGGGPPPQSPPEFGHCAKVSGGGEFTTSNCETESPTETGTYSWVPGVSRDGFTTTIKPTTTVKLEASATREKVTCTGESSSGAITGVKTVGSVVITLTGCESLAGKCTTEGLAEGELQTATLEGVLGIERTTERLGKETAYAALALKPAGGIGPFLQYTCSVSGVAVLDGSLIAPIPSGKTAKTGTFKLAASAGRQKPEAFEGGLREVLTNAVSEQVGVSLSSTLAYEEALEVNPVV